MKKKIVILLILIFLTPFVVDAYEVKTEWKKNLGGNGNDQFYSLNKTPDGGFIVTGYSNSTDIEGLPNKGEDDAIIVKYDKDGNLLWQKSWGGNLRDGFSEILQTQDGGFIVSGYSQSTDIEELPNKGESDAIIVKYDKDGNLLWQNSWGGNLYEEFYNILETQDGGFIVSGFSDSTDIIGLPNKGYEDAIIVKYDKDGNMLWQKNYGGRYSDEFYSIILTDDGGFIVVGSSSSNDIEGLPNKGETDIIIVKYDKDGNLLWQNSWGGNDKDHFYDVLQTQDGGFIVYGYSWSTDIEGLPNKGVYDAIIVKYDKDGNMLWQKNWGGNSWEEFNYILQTQDGGFIVYGYSRSTDIEGLPNKGGRDAIIVKYDKDGNMLWQKSWGGNGDEEFNSLNKTPDGGFIATGYSNSRDIEGLVYKGYYYDAITVVFDKNFNVVWQEMLGGSGAVTTNYLIFNTLDRGFITIGDTTATEIEGLGNNGRDDIMIIKYNFEYEIKNSSTENGTSTVEQQGANGIITPTPNKGYEVDKIIIKDKDGNVLDIEVVKLEDGTYSFELYTDVSVEVLFKEKIENPKTGILDIITIIFIGFAISISGFFIVKRYNERLEF